MPDFATTEEVSSLRAMLSDALAKINRPDVPATAQDAPAATAGALVVPYWEVTVCEGLTLTQGIGDDWDPRFDVLTVATNRNKGRLGTVAGEFQYIHIGASTGKRFKIAWDSDTAQTVSFRLSGMPTGTTGGWVQVKLNGQIYEYNITASQEYPSETLEGIAGRNQLVISTQYGPFYPNFGAVLFDGVASRFVDPAGLTGYVKN